MKFEFDDQTLGDLAIFQNGQDDNSILNLFNKTITWGGGDKLKEMFNNPLTDGEQINERIIAIKYLQNINVGFEVSKGPCDFIEFYLSQKNKPTSVSKVRAIEKRIIYHFNGDNEYYIIYSGIKYILEILRILQDFTEINDFNSLPKLLQNFHTIIKQTLENTDFKFTQRLNPKKLGAVDIAKADYLFRYLGYAKLKTLLDIVYQLDVFTTIGIRGKILGFSFPIIKEDNKENLLIKGLFHPFIKNAIANDIDFNNDKNICFVTGTNMAGKSTFLKAIGICIFLSQLGFPVPASYMETSVFNGIITTINLSDNINQGNSHFYTEVLRVKHVAKKIAECRNIFVIFDELFRGTNVKDAHDASLSIISAFSKIRNSFFVISTHIVEVANELAEIENINFKFMETVFDQDSPTFSYKLKNGITDERLGLWIVKNEGIIEILDDIVKNTK